MTLLKSQFNQLCFALTFLTRIPVPFSLNFNSNELAGASRYFSLVGLLIGGFCGFIYWLAQIYFTPVPSILLAMLAGLLLTGALHEDGLADSCDGLAGGWSIERKLSIMKDSRVGSYGVISLWFALSFKLCLLMQVDNVVIALIVAHTLSRITPVVIMHWLPYVSEKETSKVDLLTKNRSALDLVVALLVGVLVVMLVPEYAIAIVITLILSTILIKILLQRQIKGYTGDTLGATQQISELLVYAVLLSAEVTK